MIRYFIFFFFIVFSCFGQEVSEINKVLEIPDTLTYKKEIRIYKKYQTTYNSVIFRMYDEGNNNWIVFIYYYSDKFKDITKINGITFPKEKIGKLKPKDAELIWLNLLITNIEFLPNMETIRYKFGKPKIDSDRGERGISKTEKHVLDGVGYKVYVRNEKNINNFSFDNPETYLKYYPTVDELISYNELLSVLEKEFSF
ncbi:hypothetical protein HNP37_001132 [Flavobacterium nitrogenifigens]|uniref:Uncharacterized protein n=2 Tax=Flavobacterium TaxID=237 RepID=A0A7W7N5Y8_9FLAO|nr:MULTISPECIES: hypothetical protein [Flavobacterium]MBB4801093.1 hypothetical protein [Flavobacterium nitrogenifigens]MBB6385159.1 hypothetical protein [Flavobacterium notoginsengisoli]